MLFADTTDDLLSLAQWRGKLTSAYMRVIFAISFPIAVLNLIVVSLNGEWKQIAFQAVVLVWVVFLFFKRHANVTFLALNMLLGLYFLGVSSLVFEEWLAPIYLFALPIVAALMMSVRAALVCLAVNALTLFIVGYLLNLDLMIHGLEGSSVLSWLLVALTFTVTCGVVAVSCAFLLRSLDKVSLRLQENVQKLNELAMYDPLTGLPNRRLLDDRFVQSVHHANRHLSMFAVVFLDIDRLKSVNDSWGHQTGDALIQSVGQRIKGALRSNDTVARMGGDEFVILLTDLHSDELHQAMDRLHQAVCGVHEMTSASFDVTASMGVAVFPRDGQEQAQLFKHADAALYLAKEQGRNRYCFFRGPADSLLLGDL